MTVSAFSHFSIANSGVEGKIEKIPRGDWTDSIGVSSEAFTKANGFCLSYHFRFTSKQPEPKIAPGHHKTSLTLQLQPV